MGSKDMGCDVNFAWPTAQIAVMGASGAVGFVYRKQLNEAARNGEDVEALRLELQRDYEDTLVNPLHRRRARIRRRRHSAVAHPRLHRECPPASGAQDRPDATQEARGTSPLRRPTVKHEDITEVSDPHQLTIDVPEHGAPEIRVLKGQPTDESWPRWSACWRPCAAHNRIRALRNSTCGAPVDKLRYPFCSWQARDAEGPNARAPMTRLRRGPPPGASR